MPHLEHIGIAVRDAARTAALYETLLGVRPYKQETVAREGVRTHFIAAGTAKLELLEALGPDTPIARHLDRRGEGLHHLAFEVDDVDAELERLLQLGFEPLSDAPRPGADGKRIFFLHPKATHGVLVELCQSTPAPLTPVRVPYRGGHLAAFPFGRTDHPPLVVLHGAAGATALETEQLIRHLEPYYRVLALDFAGHGVSDDVDAPFSLAFFADNVRALLDFFEVGQAYVFGFSMGGAAALYLTRHHPERVRRLAVHATNIFWSPALVATMNARLDLDAVGRHNPRWVTRLKETHGPDRWERLYRRMLDFTQTLPRGELQAADLARIEQPTLVSAGDRDDLFGLEETLRLHRALPGSALALLPGTRHAIQTADAHVLARLLRQHFSEAASASG